MGLRCPGCGTSMRVVDAAFQPACGCFRPPPVVEVRACLECPFEYDTIRCKHPHAGEDVHPSWNSDGTRNDEHTSRPDNCPLVAPVTIRRAP